MLKYCNIIYYMIFLINFAAVSKNINSVVILM